LELRDFSFAACGTPLALCHDVSRAPRWRVVIVDDHERSRAALRAAIWAAGGEIAGEAVRAVDAMSLVRRIRPDVAVIAVGLPDGDGIQVAAEVTAEAACPVVLLTARSGHDIATRAVAAGVMAYLHKPLRPPELAPTLDVAIARFQEAHALRRQLEDRKLIERAKGVLMARHGVSEEHAFQRLRRSAMDSRRPMAEIARALLVSESVIGVCSHSGQAAGEHEA
jgi:AmiR/NasT family two-component response regulator